MSEAVAKQEINATKGTFEFRGIISNFDKKIVNLILKKKK